MVQSRSTERIATWLCLLLLAAGCLLAFWPVSFGLFSLKNDALNYFLPVRHLISESISEGHWPFWSPYFNLGYPLHGDMQSGVWNPVVQLFSLLGPYTLRMLQWETLLYVYLSGVGMFFLVRHFSRHAGLSLLAAFSFMLCGFNSDSAQFLNWISSAAYLPFCFLFYYRTLSEKKLSTAILFAVFYWLMFVSAYPADFIISGYMFLALFIWWIWQADNRGRSNIWQLVKLHLSIAVIFLLLSLPAILSFAEFLRLTERGSGAAYADVMSNPLHPLLTMTYATPLPAWKASFAEITDPLERNSYFGLVSLALLLFTFYLKTPNRLLGFFKWMFLISLLFSFGVYGGVRVIAYYLLPLMNTFRHPANARLFTIFAACFLAAYGFWGAGETANQKKRKAVFISLLVLFSALLVWALTGPLSFIKNLDFSQGAAGIKSMLDQLNFSDLLLFNILLQLPFLAALYFFFVKKINLRFLVGIAIINSVVHTMLLQPFTVVKKDSVAAMQQVLDQVQVNGYPAPDLQSSPAENSRDGEKYFDEIGVANLYNKKIGRVDYRISPSNLLSQNEFWFNPKLRDRLMTLPLFYKADTVLPLKDSATINRIEGRPLLITTSPEIKTTAGEYKAEVKKFSPNAWEIQVNSPTDGHYAFFQNHYPRWRLKVDGKEKEIDKVNVSFMGFSLPAGDHVLTLTYYSTDLKIGFYISVITLVLSLFFVAIYKRKLET